MAGMDSPRLDSAGDFRRPPSRGGGWSERAPLLAGLLERTVSLWPRAGKWCALVIGFLFVLSGSAANGDPGTVDLEGIRAHVEQMSLSELLGQTLVLGYHAQTAPDLAAHSNEGLLALVERYQPGGVILFGRNIPLRHAGPSDVERRRALRNLTESLQRVAFEQQPDSRKLPLMIAIDQEGGAKMELTKGVTRVPDPMYIGATRNPDFAFAAGRIIGEELSALGVNTVLAPVADINNNDMKDVVGKRSFGAHRDIVAPMATCFMRGLQTGGVLSIAKHFPGHGDAYDDPHYSRLPTVTYRDIDRLRSWDLHPFRELVRYGVNGLMTAHLLVPAYDLRPITTSARAIGQLREAWDYEGIVMTDDVANMMGILMYGIETVGLEHDVLDQLMNQRRVDVMQEAMQAGHDMVMLATVEAVESHKYPERTVSPEELDWIVNELKKRFGTPDKKVVLEDAVTRIVHQKSTLGPIWSVSSHHHWQTVVGEAVFQGLRDKNEQAVQEILRESVVQITDAGSFVNERSDSTLFGPGYGPLSPGRLLRSASDQLLIVSPVFREDTLTSLIREHERRWFPKSSMRTERLIYGWKTQALEAAAAHWGVEDVRRYSYRTHEGEVRFEQASITARAKELQDAAADASAVIFGVVTRAHVRILEEFLEQATEIPVLVLLSKEPYFLPAHVYETRNVSVLWAPTLPTEEVAVAAMYGKILPRTLSALSFNIPGLVEIAHREVEMAQEKVCPLKGFADYYRDAWRLRGEALDLIESDPERARERMKEALRTAKQAYEIAGDDEKREAEEQLELIDADYMALLPVLEGQ